MGQSSGEMVALAVVFMVLPLAAVFLRTFARARCHKKTKLDCWTLFLALLLNFGMCLCMIIGATQGNLGEHETYTSDNTNFITTESRIQKQTNFALNILYPLANGTTKLAFLFLYRRLFLHRQSTAVFNAVSLTLVFIFILWSLAFSIASVFTCDPISAFWSYATLPEDGPSCVSSAFFDTLAVTDLITVIAVLAFPVPATFNKFPHMSRNGQTAVCGIYVIGVFIVVAAAIRLCYFLIQGTRSYEGSDASYYSAPLQYWAIIETSVGITCACLPALGPLIGLPDGKTGSGGAEHESGAPPPAQPRIQVTGSGNTSGMALRGSEYGSDNTRETSQASWPSAVWPLPPSTQPPSQKRKEPPAAPPPTPLSVPMRKPLHSQQQPTTRPNPSPRDAFQSTLSPMDTAPTPLPPRTVSHRGQGLQSRWDWPQRSTSRRTLAPPPTSLNPNQPANATPQWPQRTTSKRARPPAPSASFANRSPLQRVADAARPANQSVSSPIDSSPPPQIQHGLGLQPLTVQQSHGHKRQSSHPSIHHQRSTSGSSRSSRGKRRSVVETPRQLNWTRPLRVGREVKVQRDSNGGLGTFYAETDDEDDTRGSGGGRGFGRAS